MESMKIHFFCTEIIQESSNDPPPREEKTPENHKSNKPKSAVLGIRYSIVFCQRIIIGGTIKDT